MAGSIKGIIVEIGGDTSGLQKALTSVNSKTTSLNKELKQINSLLKLNPNNTELLAQKQEVLNKKYEETENKLKILKDTQEEVDKAIRSGAEISEENYRALQREIVATEKTLKNLSEQSSKFATTSEQLSKVSKSFEEISAKTEKVGDKLTKTLSTTTVALGVLSGKEAVEFESAFAGVEKTVNATEEELAQLKKGIQELSKEVPSSTTEISAVAEAAGQLGIKTENIISFTKAMIDLGNSTNLTADEAASQLAKFANITQMSQKDFDKLGSSIVDLGNNFATTESDIVNMAMRLAGAGHQVGLSEGQILGLATALSSVGIEAEMGGSAISKAMVKMQNAVEMGGDKLNAVLKETGMSLRDLELMSANDSKGFKSLSQSIGMTSTEMKQLITAGTNLEDFASVSGMTAEQFKKAWKEDAAGALTAFIQGLGDAETKGESAITMLSEMGLTEVRLRDSLLRAAGAGDLFNNAIETGTKAFEENIALTNEADKRYATTASQVKIITNEFKLLGNRLGEKLLPTFNKFLKQCSKLTDSVEKMSDSEVENIIKIGLLVAAIGPGIKTIAKLEKGMSTATKIGSKFFKGLAQGEGVVTSLTGAVGKGNLTLAATVIAIAAVVAAVKTYNNYLEKNRSELSKNIDETLKNTKEQINARNELIKAQEETINAGLSEMNHVELLRKELDLIVEENGKVKEGYEARASYILNELNSALGTEYSMNGNIINQYQELKGEIDDLILKKKAKIILDSQEEAYKNAIKGQAEALKNLNKAQEEYNKALEEASKKSNNHREEAERISNLGKATEALANAKTTVENYYSDIVAYETNAARIASNNAEELKKVINSTSSSYIQNGKIINDSFAETVKAQQSAVAAAEVQYKKRAKLADDTEKQILQSQINSANQQLETTIKSLVDQTSLLENDESVVNAWKFLMTNARSVFDTQLAQLPPEMRAKIEEMVGIVRTDTTLETSASQLGEDTAKALDASNTAKQSGENMVFAAGEGMSEEDLSKWLRNSAGYVGEEAAKSMDASDQAKVSGQNVIRGFTEGTNDNNLVSLAKRTMASFGSSIIKTLNLSLGEHSPSAITKESGINLGLGLINGIKRIKPAVNRQIENMADLSLIDQDFGSVNRNISERNRNLFTTPQVTFNVQKMDEANLKACFNYINRKFGSKY